MKPFRFAPAILIAFGLLGPTSCKKESPEVEGLSYVNGVPYYHFTTTDQLWLQARQGDEWKFENTQGYRRAYRLTVTQELRAEHLSRPPVGSIIGSAKLLNYFDTAFLRVSRTDSNRTAINDGAGMLRFSRDAALLTNLNSGGKDPNTSWFYVKGEWYDFVGNTDLISDYYTCRGLKFPQAAALSGPFASLTVRGWLYTEVVAFVGTPRGADCAPLPPSYMQELYYDRQAGLVRMVSLSGEVWDRVP